jgi:hypothetical protein
MRTQHHEGSQIRTRILRTDPVKILTQCREPLKFCFVTRMASMFERRGVSQLSSYEDLQLCSLCDHLKLFFTSKFSHLLSCNHTHETGSRITNRWGTTNSKPPGAIIIMCQLETLSSSQIIFITSFLSVRSVTAPFSSYRKLCTYSESKPFS